MIVKKILTEKMFDFDLIKNPFLIGSDYLFENWGGCKERYIRLKDLSDSFDRINNRLEEITSGVMTFEDGINPSNDNISLNDYVEFNDIFKNVNALWKLIDIKFRISIKSGKLSQKEQELLVKLTGNVKKTSIILSTVYEDCEVERKIKFLKSVEEVL